MSLDLIMQTTNEKKRKHSDAPPTQTPNVDKHHGIGQKKRKFSNENIHQKKFRPQAKSDNLNLPVYKYAQEIVNSVKNNQVTIIVGETGSGKSTQIPQILLDHQLVGSGKCIVCTQPRRVAAVTIAQKVASERNGPVGGEVGYSIRFEDKSSPVTRIKYATDGVLLREFMSDPVVTKYDIVILDEAHERSLQTDILMGLLKQIQMNKSRDDLKIIVMSATLQVELFANFFESTNLVVVPGRQFPVSILYTPEPEPEFLDAALIACLQIHEEEEEPGGVLVFLPGQEEIESLTLLLQDHLPSVHPQHPLTVAPQASSSVDVTEEQDGSKTVGVANLRDFLIRPLYAAMPPDEQLRVFEPAPQGVRKFILATNIAETSVTISGVKYVVDTGFVKTRFINEKTGVEMLKRMPVSKSQANQRAGRAGRESAGKCFRLYPEDAFETLQELTIPEIQRMNIAQVFLQLKTLNVASFKTFPFLSSPTPMVARQALETLLVLGALDKDQQLTEIGRQIALLPLHPTYAFFLLKARDFHCVQEALIAVSVLSADTIFMQPFREEDKQRAFHCHRLFASRDGDILTLVNVFQQWAKANKDKHWAAKNFLSHRALLHAENIKDQLTTLLRDKLRIDVTLSCFPEEKEKFLKCLCFCFAANVAQSIQSVEVSKSQQQVSKASSNLVVKNNKFAFTSTSSQLSESLDAQNITGAPYRTLRGHQFVHIHPSSVLFSMIKTKKLPAFVLYADLLTTNKQYMRNISVIDGSWLSELFPQKFKTVT